MAINRVQFQQGLPGVEFMSLHDTEAKYHRSLDRARWTAGRLALPDLRGWIARARKFPLWPADLRPMPRHPTPLLGIPKGPCWRLEVRRAACEVHGARWVNILKPQARDQRQRPHDLAGMAEIGG